MPEIIEKRHESSKKQDREELTPLDPWKTKEKSHF